MLGSMWHTRIPGDVLEEGRAAAAHALLGQGGGEGEERG